ncbi:helix-turn-helix domain-containing protein [Salegentibacter flavus]|uniref:Helix-turn-helix n=1 Tax=Salegentibacter flavus TaxID=287099 RepID=A0A1I4ZI75_9FLAO|nr:helix-turn-helix transcriptional regulator [Salegentibacter flavus]SFN49857.1 Helix-turn-helix [Salegentibacter flavus]
MDIEISNSKFLNIFGERLKYIRQQSNLSYRELGKRCDLDYSYISKVEKGERNIQLSTILELAKGLEVHPKDLFDFSLSEQNPVK